jgi:PIN domain nuclease of toxin-antitoxin system
MALDSPRLSVAAREAYKEVGTEIFLSSVSVWEIVAKHALGKLSLPEPPDLLLPRMRTNLELDSLPLTESEVLVVARLPRLHRDPHDRLLIAQSIENGMVLVTPDEQIARYPVKTLW